MGKNMSNGKWIRQHLLEDRIRRLSELRQAQADRAEIVWHWHQLRLQWLATRDDDHCTAAAAFYVDAVWPARWKVIKLYMKTHRATIRYEGLGVAGMAMHSGVGRLIAFRRAYRAIRQGIEPNLDDLTFIAHHQSAVERKVVNSTMQALDSIKEM